MAVSTGNQIADGSNVAASTSIQFIAVDTGRATNSEDLLLDGVGNSTSTADAILCPFATSTSSVIPPFCNIIQAGSSFDSTLTSTTTSASDRFVGTDSTYPVTLNYKVASEGITLSDGTSSPMIGSASAYVKAHIQEARNTSTTKSEDYHYSETSTAKRPYFQLRKDDRLPERFQPDIISGKQNKERGESSYIPLFFFRSGHVDQAQPFLNRDC